MSNVSSSTGMVKVKAMQLRLYRYTTRVSAMLRAICRMKAQHRKDGPSLLTLPVEILLSIRDFLPLGSAVCFTISSRHLLGSLGWKLLYSLREKVNASEKKRFLVALERDLPNWQLCHPCLLFHPVSPSNRPEPMYLRDGKTTCVLASGVVDVSVKLQLRYHQAQLIMNHYRFGLPYANELERLCHHYQLRRSDSCVEITITAYIEDGGLAILAISKLHLPNGWDMKLIGLRLQRVCRHNGVDILFPDQTLIKTLRCRLSHGDGPPCAKCSEWKRCKFCSTSFLVKVHGSVKSETSIVLEVREFLGSCKDPSDPDWRDHSHLPLRVRGRERAPGTVPRCLALLERRKTSRPDKRH